MMPWDWEPQIYISAAEKRRRAEKAMQKLARKGGEILQPVRVEGKNIADSFWGKSWCRNMESYSDYGNRLPRGRSYVRSGAVVDLQISAGSVKALVSGSRLYHVSMKIDAVERVAWDALKAQSSGQVANLFDLLQGKLSASVMEIMSSRESGLFPGPSEISFSCSCPDSASMCKHIAAVFYGIGVRLDHSPALLFTLRGADHLELIAEAADSVAAGARGAGGDGIAADALGDIFGIEIDLGDVVLPSAKTVPGGKKKAAPRRKSAAASAAVSKAKPRRKSAAGKSVKPEKAKPSAGPKRVVKLVAKKKTATKVKAGRKSNGKTTSRRKPSV